MFRKNPLAAYVAAPFLEWDSCTPREGNRTSGDAVRFGRCLAHDPTYPWDRVSSTRHRGLGSRSSADQPAQRPNDFDLGLAEPA